MKIKNITRAADWWGYKLPALLSVGYATIFIAHQSLLQPFVWILFLLASLIAGAAYVSVVNDVTDIKEDIVAGKNNNMHRFSLPTRLIIIGFCVAIGAVFMYYLFPDKLSFFLYLMSWISFSLYSIPPARLKTKGIWGVFADACGAHVFPSCLMVSSLCFFMASRVNWQWFSAVAIWALALGLRGILSHQFSDREQDIVAGVSTYASKIAPEQFKNKSLLLIELELVAFVAMLFIISSWVVCLFLLIYLAYALLRYKLHKTRFIIIILNEKENFRVIMMEYYQVFFPLSILTATSIHYPYGWMILLLHVIVFYKTIYLTFNEIFTIAVLRRLVKV